MSDQSAPHSSMAGTIRWWLGACFGLSTPVSRRLYFYTGVGLMAVKYAAEAAFIWLMTGRSLTLLDFVNPLLSARMSLLQGAPEWAGWALVVWSLPFLWIAASMSIRRSTDAGLSPWPGMLVLVPIVNLPAMLILAALPHREVERPYGETLPADDTSAAMSALLGIGGGVATGAAAFAVSVLFLESYGAVLFLSTPFFVGVVSGYACNRSVDRGAAATLGVVILSLLLSAAALLLFALEGLICILMALPLAAIFAPLGGLIGKGIADQCRGLGSRSMYAIALLPALAFLEFFAVRADVREVRTAVEIDAPPQVVWQNVIAFPDLPEPTEWYFRAGIAAPIGAHIDGNGVGAVRHCRFTTGDFVEPITVWDQPRRLAFDVTEQPEPMFELTPYREIHPPHLHGTMRSVRGEFRLIEQPGGRTRLEGSTWYLLSMWPQEYWIPWSDGIVHRIHRRVLEHVRDVSEAAAAN
ncbi:SRPBCC family protein [Maioricimonas sp. JC845]|uniref:DUF805 domain-containing protein n=1 Tax=Maioricimonas sp. JC845 TaxID=3232138 RepID=UPI00345A02C3